MEDKILEKIINIIRLCLNEEGIISAPTNNVSSGNIAGTPESDFPNPPNPPVFQKKKKNKYIYGKGYRKLWKGN